MPQPTLSDVVSCLSDYDPDALPVAQAQRVIREFIAPIHCVEKLALRAALGRVLAADIIPPPAAPPPAPPAMDGYALRSDDLAQDEAVTLKIIGTALAGCSHQLAAASGECVRIMTGAIMPVGCDTVIPQEFTKNATTETVDIPPGIVKTGDNRRLKGEDLLAGKPALAKGKILRPADIGMLASLGITEVPEQRRLRVAFFSTGDELRAGGGPRAGGGGGGGGRAGRGGAGARGGA